MVGTQQHASVSVSSIGTLFRYVTSKFETLSNNIQFGILVTGVFIFFGLHNFLQEAIMHIPKFTSGVMLGYFEVVGVSICSYIERKYIVHESNIRKAPLSSFSILTLCLLSSSALSNMSLNYINFPTKVVFRSCKLIPTMIIASIVHKKVFSIIEYTCAISACTGLILFAAADWETSPSFHPIGLLLVSLSICADAVLPNAQEKLFKLGSSRLEVTFYTNIFTLGIMTLTTLISGDLWAVLQQMFDDHKLLVYFSIYTFIAYIAISFHMNIVKRYGGVAAVLVATGRKAMTLIISFIIFPKGFTWLYPLGAILVLGGLLVASLTKVRNSGSKKEKTQHAHGNGGSGLPLHNGEAGGGDSSEQQRSSLLKAHASDVANNNGNDTTTTTSATESSTTTGTTGGNAAVRRPSPAAPGSQQQQ